MVGSLYYAEQFYYYIGAPITTTSHSCMLWFYVVYNMRIEGPLCDFLFNFVERYT